MTTEQRDAPTERDREPGAFPRRFAPWARRVRARLLTRRVLTGIAFGLVAGGGAAAVLWWLRLGELRVWAAALGALGGLVGLVVAVRQRWSDVDVALYLDAKLDSDETIATAVELHAGGPGSEAARETVVRRAARALAAGDPKRARPRVLAAWQALAPVGLAAVIWLSLVPLPAAPPPPVPEPGVDQVQIADLEGLEKIIALEKLDARDAEQRERLQQIAAEARKLREDLARGIPRREAQARIAKLRDDIAAERLRFGDEMNRPGLDAAVRKLAENPHTKAAARALSDGDLTRFDEEMRRLANQAEQEDRESAKRALEEAAKAARERGAQGLADALDEQRNQFDQRGAESDALRELGEGLRSKLSEEALRDLEEFGATGSPEARKRLAEAMRKALEGLTEEERKRLKEKLQQQAEGEDGQVNPMTKEQLEELARRLATEEGQKELAERLKEMAEPKPSPEAQREQGLEDAERGGAQCQRQLGGAVPIPMEGSGSLGQGNQNGKPPGGNPEEGRPGGPGSGRDDDPGDHDGKTDPVPGQELRSKANPNLDPTAPMHGTSLGRAPAREGETANQRGTGALGRVAPKEVGGVQRSEVPEEYREQVGRYFQP